jgi:hypothetical protein
MTKQKKDMSEREKELIAELTELRAKVQHLQSCALAF